jgi:DNA-binding transcriptional LysR family regulator
MRDTVFLYPSRTPEDIIDFRYLSASVELGNFASAAKSLGLNTSAVSRRVARLEDELGLTLFERGRFGVRLTTGGKAVMVHVRRMLADFDAVLRAGASNGSGEIGEIRLGVRMPPVGEPLRSLLIDWRERYPNVAIKFHETGLAAGSASLQADALDFLSDASNYGISLSVIGLALVWRARAALVKGVSMGLLGGEHPLARGCRDAACSRGHGRGRRAGAARQWRGRLPAVSLQGRRIQHALGLDLLTE